VLLARTADVDYSVEHWHGYLFVVKRTAATPNSELLLAPLDAPEQQTVLRAHQPNVKLEDVEVFERHLATMERANGLSECHVFALPHHTEASAVRSTSACMRRRAASKLPSRAQCQSPFCIEAPCNAGSDAG
jgi:protease II